MFSYSLGGEGYEVTLAAGGREAIEKARGNTFDLALCDLMMPGMDGIETLHALKELQPAIKVVMTTGCATEETLRQSMKEGANDYIAKPCDLTQLMTLLEKTLAIGRAI